MVQTPMENGRFETFPEGSAAAIRELLTACMAEPTCVFGKSKLGIAVQNMMLVLRSERPK